MYKSLLAAVAAALFAAPAGHAAPAQLPDTFDFGSASAVSYHLVHALHQVTGVSHALRGRVTLAGDRLATPMTLRLPLVSFESGNANRDANAAATLDVGRFPAAVLEVRRFTETSRTALPGGAFAIVGEAVGQLGLHGVIRPVSVPLRARVAPEGVTVDATFEVSLTAYQIPRPSLLFKPVDDVVKVSVHGVAAPVAL